MYIPFLIFLSLFIYGCFKIPINKWSIYVYDILICLISFIFHSFFSADQNGKAGTLIAYIYITMLLPILIIIKFIVNALFVYFKLNYWYYIISMLILLLFLSYLAIPNDDSHHRFFNTSNSLSYFYKYTISNLFLLFLYYKKWLSSKDIKNMK